jgi:hypothetical protein
MKMKGTSMWIGVTALAVALGPLAILDSYAQSVAGISRVGWLEVCGPGPQRPNFDIFQRRLAELATLYTNARTGYELLACTARIRTSFSSD